MSSDEDESPKAASPATPRRADSVSSSGRKLDKSASKLMKVKVDAFQFDSSTQYEPLRGFVDHDSAARLTKDQIAPNPLPPYCAGMSGAFKGVRGLVSKKKKRFTEDGYDLDLTYITPKIIAMGFPSSGREGLFRNPLPEVQRFFESRHAGRYRIYNLCSEKAYDVSDFLGRVARYPFDDHNPCPLPLLGAFCEDVDAWLTAHTDNVVAVHCKAGKGRTGTVIAAYLMHCGFKATSEAALRWFGFARTANGKGVTIASQMRYVHYYEQILRGGFPVTYTYRLHRIRFRTTPNFDPTVSTLPPHAHTHRADSFPPPPSSQAGGCAPWFQLFIDNIKVFDFKAAVGGGKALARYRKGELYADMDVTPFALNIANNVKLQFMHEAPTGGSAKMCHLWFHTGFVTRNYLSFGKAVVDKASKDKKGLFHPAFAVEFFLDRIAEPPTPPLPESGKGGKGSKGSGTDGLALSSPKAADTPKRAPAPTPTKGQLTVATVTPSMTPVSVSSPPGFTAARSAAASSAFV
jgi:phosphatidylinositol-3,4,5-trisphosphate 3-phosphatase/dual-specificity protein phosphatase PTEN